MPTSTQYLRRRLALVFAAATVFLYLRTFLLRGIPFIADGDQVLFFVRAARIVHGQTLYRDIFELVTPGTGLLYAISFRIFGIHAWVPAAWAVLLGAALAAQLTWLAAKLLRGSAIYLPALLFLVFDYNSALDPTHHWYSTFFALAAAGILCEAITRPRLIAAGTLAALATLFTQTQGTLALLAIAAWLLWITRTQPAIQRLKQHAALIVPFCAIVFATLGYYAHLASARTLYFDLITFPIHFLSADPSVNSPRTYLQQLPPLHTPSDLFRLIPFLFIYAVAPYIYLVALWLLHRRRTSLASHQHQRVLLFTLTGLALTLAIASGPRFHRICTIAPPALLLFVWTISAATLQLHRLRVALAAVALAFAAGLAVHRQHQPHAVLDLPIGRTAFTDIQSLDEFRWLASRTRPGDLFFGQSRLALYLGLINPTTTDFINDNETTRPQAAAAALAALQQHPPRFILLPPLPPTPTSPHDHAAPLRAFIHQHYRVAQTFLSPEPQRTEQMWELLPLPSVQSP